MIDKLEARLSDCIGIAGENVEDHRKEMIDLRRDLNDQTHIVLETGLQLLEGTINCDAFRNQHSMLRIAIAIHQSSSPISVYELTSEH